MAIVNIPIDAQDSLVIGKRMAKYKKDDVLRYKFCIFSLGSHLMCHKLVNKKMKQLFTKVISQG